MKSQAILGIDSLLLLQLVVMGFGVACVVYLLFKIWDK